MNWFKRIFGPNPAKPQPSGPADSPVAASGRVGRHELLARYRALSRPAVHLRPRTGAGFSRLGGLPTMPETVPWPTWQEKPQAFLAQIDLKEVSHVMRSFLPTTGYLYFFYDQDQGVWGFDPKDAGGWRVLYVEGDGASFPERAAPAGLAEEFIYQPKPVTPCGIDLLPDTQALPQESYDYDRDGDAYYQLRSEAFGTGTVVRHQMLGYPSPIQNPDMELECQLTSNGISTGTAAGYQDPRVAELKAGARDWKLLLQLESDDDIGWMWGDVGTLYFWVREQDARAGDFSRVRMVFQCS